jgi:Arc/MetJ family transcription regulator
MFATPPLDDGPVRCCIVVQHLPGEIMTVRLNITMDDAVYARLKRKVRPKKMSVFITEAVRARLTPDRATLDAAYRAASKERWRRRLADDWRRTETEAWPE